MNKKFYYSIILNEVPYIEKLPTEDLIPVKEWNYWSRVTTFEYKCDAEHALKNIKKVLNLRCIKRSHKLTTKR